MIRRKFKQIFPFLSLLVVLSTLILPFEFLGKSKHATVWGSPFHSYAIKAGRTPEANQNEYTMLSKAYQTLKQYDPEKTFQTKASFIEPIYQSGRVLIVKRIYPLENHSELLALKLRKKYQFLKKFAHHFSSSIGQLCYDLGRLLAILQLGAKIDGNDFEFYLAKDSKQAQGYKIFLLDLEKAQDVSEKFRKKQTENLITLFIKAIQEKHYAYFPPTNTKGFTHFRKGYQDFAVQLDKETGGSYYSLVAHKLLDRLEKVDQEQLLSRNL